MLNILNQVVEQIQVREAFYAPLPCSMCSYYPATEGAVCADCIFDNHIKIPV